MHKLVLLIALVLISMAASAQTTKKEIRKACSAEAKEQGLKGAEAKTFREDCMQKRLAALPAEREETDGTAGEDETLQRGGQGQGPQRRGIQDVPERLPENKKIIAAGPSG